MRIAIVTDPSPKPLIRLILSEPGNEIAWTAVTGDETIEKCGMDRPDAIFLDLDRLEGASGETTRRIMAHFPCRILLITRKIADNTSKIIESIGFGAIDAVDMPQWGMDAPAVRLRSAFLQKLRTLAKFAMCIPPGISRVPKDPLNGKPCVPKMMAIGASTGGPETLAKILFRMPMDLDVVITIVQHMKEEFSGNLAQWLASQTPLTVRLAMEGERPKPGIVYLAGTNDHLVMTREHVFAVTPEPRNRSYRPSVDVFFHSLAENWPRIGVAILLTGMGRDGAEGLAKLRHAGWHTIAQDEQSSVVYGMPKAAKEIGAAIQILPIDHIGPAALRFFQRAGGTENEKNTQV